MFMRRDPLPIHRKALAAVWPEMGWRRASRYLMVRVGRLPGSGQAIAGGFAWGAAMSFTPFIGLHILLSAFGAWISRCSIVAAVLGTIVGNPWTFPFIWIWLYKAGVFLGFGKSGIDAEAMDFSALFGKITEAALREDWAYIAEHAMPVLTHMLVASIPSAIIVWVIFFLLLKPIIERYKSAAAARRTDRAVALIEGMHSKQEGTA